MKISIIIPTHNRQDLLKSVIESIIRIKDESDFEIIIVDNNSTDGTKLIAETYSQYANYVFEKRTSFTCARKTGGENAKGDILLYIDDDVIVNPGSLKNIEEIFQKHPDCGVIAGKILPKFLEKPSTWVQECQKSFNGWSLYNIDKSELNNDDLKEVTWAAGPMMAIRKTAYDMVGGFPPDTIGVETNKGGKTFNKLYIGPGDYGLCYKIIKAGFKVYYSNNVSVYHIIPPLRFTIKFWRSRMIGEGYHEAITQREFFKLNSLRSDIKRERFQNLLNKNKKVLTENIINNSVPINGMLPQELWVFYYKAYLDMDTLLRKYKNLSSYLWEIASLGVDDENFDSVMAFLPEEFKNLVNDEYIYNNTPINSVKSYNSILEDFGTPNKLITNYNKLIYETLKWTLQVTDKVKFKLLKTLKESR